MDFQPRVESGGCLCSCPSFAIGPVTCSQTMNKPNMDAEHNESNETIMRVRNCQRSRFDLLLGNCGHHGDIYTVYIYIYIYIYSPYETILSRCVDKHCYYRSIIVEHYSGFISVELT